MHIAYKHLTFIQRCRIQAYWWAGYTATAIAKEIGVHKSTISHEFRRNISYFSNLMGRWTYKADYAQGSADDRCKEISKHVKFTDDVKAFVTEKIQKDWGPEQISGYTKRHGLFSISHERIYQFILQDKKQGGELYKHLRHQNKRYRKRYGSPKRQGSIRNKRFIDERPAIVDEKSRIGDWEVDTIIGKNRKQAIVSIVERKSKFTILKKVQQKTSESVSQAIINRLKSLTNKVLTITSDNGSEFAKHETIRVMDGMHRVCKAVLENKEYINAVQFEEMIQPDFIGIVTEDLPYD